MRLIFPPAKSLIGFVWTWNPRNSGHLALLLRALLALLFTAVCNADDQPAPNGKVRPSGTNATSVGEKAFGLAKSAREYFDRGDYDKALESALAADSLMQTDQQLAAELRVKSLAFISEIYLKKGLFAAAEKRAREATDIVRSSSKTSLQTDFLKAYGFLVKSLFAQGKHKEGF